jgi:NRPS condensation-like uncharacterized protein
MAIPNKLKVTAQDAYNYAASKMFADQQLCMVLELSGKLDEGFLAKAARLTLDLEPVLGCRLTENGGNPFWERRADLDQIKTGAIVETASAEAPLQNFINEPTYAGRDPIVNLRIFREKDRDTLCIKVNHAACDAGGLKEYVSLLSDFYGMLSTCGRTSIQPNLGRRDQSQIFEHTKDPRTFAMKGFPKPTWALPQKAGNEPRHIFRAIPHSLFE